MNLAPEQKNELLYVSFNQDQSCFACGTDRGFFVCNVDPLKERFRRDFDGGIGIIEMLFRCNILALVGGGKNPKYPPNKVMIWDDYQNKCIAELEFRSEVKAVKLRRDRIIVVLENKVYVYNFADLKLLHQLETAANPKGLVALCPSTNYSVLACPGLKPGYVHVELYDVKRTSIITAHNNPISQISLNLEGTKLATSSDKGTIIRVFDTATAQKLMEFRRGADRAEIYSLSFNSTSAWLCCSSDKGTVHVYGLGPAPDTEGEKDKRYTRQSSLSFLTPILPAYFGSEWSFSQFRVPESHSICAFGPNPNSVIVLCSDGAYYKFVFDLTRGGESRQDAYAKFLQRDDGDT